MTTIHTPQSSPHTGVRSFLIDCSTYTINNLGDIAMLQAVARPLLARYPGALLRVVTNDPEGVRAAVPDAEPLVVGDRRMWSLVHSLTTQENRDCLATFLAREDAAWRRDPAGMARALEQAGKGGAAAARLGWARAVRDADAAIVMGGGYFSEPFADHAAFVLQTLGEAVYAGKPAAIVGCGFEPVEDPLLHARAADVLPRLGLIACREGRTSPVVLRNYGVPADRVHVAGDDAIEAAHRARGPTLGDAIGVNVRIASYSGFSLDSDREIADQLRAGLRSVAAALGAELVPLPISNYAPSDPEAIAQLLPGVPTAPVGMPDELFGRVSRCRVVVTGSYHAAVFALAQGIPAVALARTTHYRLKMGGLLELFGADSLIDLDEPGLVVRLERAVRQAWEEAPAHRLGRLARARQLIDAGSLAYQRLFELIERGRSEPAQEVPDDGSWLAWMGLLVSVHRQIDGLQKWARDLEQHATARLEQVVTLTRIADERLGGIHAITAMADERLAAIHALTAMADERLASIHRLTAMADERLELIHRLDAALRANVDVTTR